jgi:hypothetical protein
VARRPEATLASPKSSEKDQSVPFIDGQTPASRTSDISGLQRCQPNAITPGLDALQTLSDIAERSAGPGSLLCEKYWTVGQEDSDMESRWSEQLEAEMTMEQESTSHKAFSFVDDLLMQRKALRARVRLLELMLIQRGIQVPEPDAIVRLEIPRPAGYASHTSSGVAVRSGSMYCGNT